ncbi:hypothetical protein GX830_02270 [Candidatus Dojkabacteria bacterium]|nr:hypothetical protein [Candidatus Dojkabacteria bacterium]
MKVDLVKSKAFLILLTVLLLVIFLVIYLRARVQTEVKDECMVPSTKCEEMDMLPSCPKDAICKETLVGWSSEDADCPTYKVYCFEEVK